DLEFGVQRARVRVVTPAGRCWTDSKDAAMFRRGALMRFRDRADAGRQLGRRLRELRLVDPVVLALPRGGVPVAFEAAGVAGAATASADPRGAGVRAGHCGTTRRCRR